MYKFQMLCPILLLLNEGEEDDVQVENLDEVLHQEEVWVEDCKETFRATNCLTAGQNVPNFTWNDTENDGDNRSINILSQV